MMWKMDKQIGEGVEKIFLGLAILTPLVVMPEMNLAWEVGKVYWLWLIVEAWWWWRIMMGRESKIGKGYWISLLVWIGGWGLTAAASNAGGNTVWGGWWRRQGWLTFAHLAGLGYLALGVKSGEWVRKMIVAVGVMVLILGMGMAGGKTRWTGTLGEANSWAAVGVLAGVLAGRIAKGSVGLGAFAAVVLAQSRAAGLALMAGIMGTGKKSAIWFLMAAVLGVMFVWATWWRGSGERIEVWRQSMNLWRESPWIGVGLDNFQSRFGELMAGKGLEWSRFDQPHNIVLWVMVSTGSIGLGVFGGWMWWWGRGGDVVWQRAVVAMLVYGLWQPWSISVWVMFMIVMSRLGACEMEKGESEVKVNWVRVGVVGAIAVWTFGKLVWPTFAGYY